jgi:hypothetical protein
MTALNLYGISVYFSLAGTISIALLCLLHFKNRAPHIKVLAYYSSISILFAIAQNYGTSGVVINFIGIGFVLLEAILFSVFYALAINKASYQKFIFCCLLLYLMSYFGTYIYYKSESFSFIRMTRDLLMIILSLSYFYFVMKEITEENLLRSPLFWINTAMLFFFSGTFVLSFLVNYIANVLGDDLAGFWAFRNFFRFAFCLVLAYAGWLDLKLLKQH